MATREVTLYATAFGAQVGPFNITDNFSNTVALGVTTQQILSTIVLTVNDTADTLYLTSIGRCDNTILVRINAIAPSPTASPSITASPSKTPSITPSITISPSKTPSITTSTSTTPSITVTPSRTVTSSPTPTITPSISISKTPTTTPSTTPTITPSTSVQGINSCALFNDTNIYLKVNWYNSGSISSDSSTYDIYGGYCGDNVGDYAYVTVEFYRDSTLTVPVNLSNIRISGVSLTGAAQKSIELASDSGLNTGILTNNQSSVTFQSILYSEYLPDVTQEGYCTGTTQSSGLYITFGCSSIDKVTLQQNIT